MTEIKTIRFLSIIDVYLPGWLLRAAPRQVAPNEEGD